MSLNDIKIAALQLNPHLGALEDNAAGILDAYNAVIEQNPDLVVTPELSLTGYPADDLILEPYFIQRTKEEVFKLANQIKSPPLLIGAPWQIDGKIYNVVLKLENKSVQIVSYKSDLPHYGPFSEKRTFESGKDLPPLEVKGEKIGLLICEDGWTLSKAKKLSEQGATSFISMNASPYTVTKKAERLEVAQNLVKECKAPLLYLNQSGGQDELIFDGASFLMNENGNIVDQANLMGPDTKLWSLACRKRPTASK